MSIEAITTWVESSGNFVYALAPLFTVAVAILPIPAEIPAMLNGMVFGPVFGTLVTWVSALVGAQISFELARCFGRPLGKRLFSERAFERVDDVADAAGWPGLLALRLVPTVAFTMVNWGAGFTSMRRTTFAWTTAVGILPGAIAFTTTGSGVLELMRGSARPTWWLVIGTTMVVLMFAVALIWRRRSRTA